MARMARPTGAGSRVAQSGLAYLALLIAIAVMGVALGLTGSFWHTVQQRAKERELLFVGLQYRRAIENYYVNSPGAKTYPPNLEALLRDIRYPGTVRYLRRPYRDPLTNSDKWGLVPAPTGGIMGIYSLAEGEPIKQTDFPAELGWLSGKATYAQWQFVY